MMRSPICRKRFLTVLLLSYFSIASDCCSLTSGDETQDLLYAVDVSGAKNHYVGVELTTVADSDQTELMMAVWTPGSYLVREYARHIDSLKVTDGDGNPLPFEKTRKNRWLVETTPGQELNVSYRLYCNDVSVRTNFVNHRFAVLNGAPTFLTIPDRRDQPHHVQLKLPKGWNNSTSSLLADGKRNHYVAANFDELVDSPIVAGLIDIYPFKAGGIEHVLVNVGESGYWDGKAAAADLAKIVQQHQAMWDNVPYDRYLFMNVITEGRGGLEHDDCTLILASRWAYRIPEKYQDWLSLASHEFFHTWNVRRLRPKPLMNYDYENEIYTDSLWIAEGITSYYEDLALIRAGLIDRKEYLKRLSKNIEKVQTAHGRHVQSLHDASFDTWIKFYRPDENSPNTRVSYYDKGAIVAFLLDIKLRQQTNNEKCLDDVLRAMYTNFWTHGYTQADFRTTASEVAGTDLKEWFVSAIDSTDELNYEPAIAWLGLEFGAKEADEEEEGDNDEASAEPDAEDVQPWIGVELDGKSVKLVQAESPASEAGINTGDELLAINGFQLHESLEEHLKQFQVGDQVELLVARSGQLFVLDATLAAEPKAEWELKELPEPTEQQLENRRSWLQDEEHAAESKAEPSD